MPTQSSYGSRLHTVLVPTPLQAYATIVLAVLALLLAHTQAILSRIGITQVAITATNQQFHERFDTLLQSSVASDLTLLTFWAAVGLIAYIACWALYNMLIDVRNEVTIKTAYINLGGNPSRGAAIGIKFGAAICLAALLFSLRPGVSLWIALSSSAALASSFGAWLQALAAICGLALQLYLIVIFIQLTFTPWYRAQTFTD